MSEKSRLSRRQVLGQALGAGAAAAGALVTGPGDAAARGSGPRSRVVLIREARVLDAGGKVRAEVLSSMLDRAVTRLLGARDPATAWRRLIKPGDTVGVKSNVWAHLPTPPELDAALVQRVRGVGVRADRVSVGDRSVLRDKVFLSSTALINVRPMRTHHWSGVGSLIKNYIMFVPEPWRYHPDSCARLGNIWKLPLVAGKTRLNILVMLTPLFYGVGPHHYDRKYVWRYSGLLVGTDPVAVDTTGLRILEAKRRAHFGEYRRMRPPARHIALAGARYGLGQSDPKRIELVKLGWTKGRLI